MTVDEADKIMRDFSYSGYEKALLTILQDLRNRIGQLEVRIDELEQRT
jgi:hypothetical protein